MKKFDNFCKALDNLEDIYKYEEPYDIVVLTGLVALYEICFESVLEGSQGSFICKWNRRGSHRVTRSIIKLAYSVNLNKGSGSLAGGSGIQKQCCSCI